MTNIENDAILLAELGNVQIDDEELGPDVSNVIDNITATGELLIKFWLLIDWLIENLDRGQYCTILLIYWLINNWIQLLPTIRNLIDTVAHFTDESLEQNQDTLRARAQYAYYLWVSWCRYLIV